MSRAYCLTCNEHVPETARGTCPQGHPVSAHDEGPEPWVGFAGDGELPVDAARLGTRRPVEMAHLDAGGRPVAHAGTRPNGSANGTVNGSGATLGGGHGSSDPFPSTFGHRSSFASDPAPAAPTERAPANGQAADDLAALLAEALSEESTPKPVVPDAVRDELPVDHTDLDTVDADALDDAGMPGDDAPPWNDLANLAAELQLDTDRRDDGPVAPPPSDAVPTDEPDVAPPAAGPAEPPAAPTVEPAPEGLEGSPLDESAIDSADIDALLAELTSGAATPPPAPDAATPPPAPAPPPEPEPAPEAVTPPPPPVAPPAPPTPAPSAEATPWDAPPPPDDVPSAPSAPEAVDAWDHPVPADDAPAPTVDLANFTARGGRVGGAGAARKKRSRKR